MSGPRRFFLASERLTGSVALLDGPQGRHLTRVVRARPGQLVLLFDENGTECETEVVALDRHADTAQLRILRRTAPAAARPTVHLAVALLKGAKLDAVIRAAGAVGVTSVRPFLTSRAVPKPGAPENLNRAVRWDALARETVKASPGRTPPAILPVRPYSRCLQELGTADLRLILHERATRPLREVLGSAAQAASVALVLGPEGGFSETEIEESAHHGFEPVSLGPVVLRAEAAAQVALAITLYAAGRLG